MSKKMLLVDDYREMGTLTAGDSTSTKKVFVKNGRGASTAKRTSKPNVVLLVRHDAQAA